VIERVGAIASLGPPNHSSWNNNEGGFFIAWGGDEDELQAAERMMAGRLGRCGKEFPGGSWERNIDVELREFADLSDGRRIVADERHGRLITSVPRNITEWRIAADDQPGRGITPIPRDVTVRDLEDMARRSLGQIPFMNRWRRWASDAKWTGLVYELRPSNPDGKRRRRRWSALRRTFADHEIRASRRKLDRRPFVFEIDDGLRDQLTAPRDPT